VKFSKPLSILCFKRVFNRLGQVKEGLQDRLKFRILTYREWLIRMLSFDLEKKNPWFFSEDSKATTWSSLQSGGGNMIV
jgi:hypothetical protein